MPALKTFGRRKLQLLLDQVVQPNQFLTKMFKGKDVSDTVEVQVDIIKGNQKSAPYVKRGLASEVVKKDGYETKTIRPPRISMKKDFSPSELVDIREPGQDPYSSKKPSKQGVLVAKEMKELQLRATRAKEIQAAQGLTTGKVSFVESGAATEIDFLFPTATFKTLTAAARWDQPTTATPADDLQEWRLQIKTKTNLSADTVLMNSATFKRMIRTNAVQNDFDRYNLNRGVIDTKNDIGPDGEIFKGTIDAMKIYVYDEIYVDAAGTVQNMIPDSVVVVCASKADYVQHYGAVEDIEEGSNEVIVAATDFYTTEYITKDPPCYWFKAETCPLLVPHYPEAIVIADTY